MYVLGYSGFTRDARHGQGRRSPFANTARDFDSLFAFRDGEVPFPLFPLGYFGHDASAALLHDGRVVACAAEERFTRVKYSLNLAGNTLLPVNAVRYCIAEAGITMDDVDLVAHYCAFTSALVDRRCDLLRPFLSDADLTRLRASYGDVYEEMMSLDAVHRQFTAMAGCSPRCLVPVRHHRAHAASAFFPSGFPEALVATMDGTGEVESGMIAVGSGRSITEIATASLPASLGTLYLIITVFLGFRSLGDEYKVMGLASYGDPSRYRRAFERFVQLGPDGTYGTPLLPGEALKDHLLSELGLPRAPGEELGSRHADIAAALQDALHRAVMHVLAHARHETGLDRLCLAGGVALNCTLNGVIARSGLFKRVFVQPASGDEGCSIGAAYAAYLEETGGELPDDRRWEHAYWGPGYADGEVMNALQEFSDRVSWVRSEDIVNETAARLASGQVVGWYQGRMEFGPRALGNRSILADPRDAGMKDRINEKVKRREQFRPFAPAIPCERAAEFFDMSGLPDSPFMLFTVPVWERCRAVIPAVTHVDGTARLQTVARATNPRFWDLLHAFGRLTGVPVLLNTSFNVRNEPIVCTPHDACACFVSTEIDCLVIGDYIATKRVPQ